MTALTFEGGLNEQDPTLVNPAECIEGKNFELGSKNTHLNPRKPFDLAGTTSNGSQIQGFIQLIKADNTETTLVQSGTTVYDWDGASTFTSKGTVDVSSQLRGTTWTLDSYSVITDISKATVVKKWDGTSLTTLTTGLGATLFAKYGVVHLGRMWLFNVKSGTDTPHLMVASAFEDPESYDTSKRAKDSSFSTGEEAFFMVTPDLKPINGVTLFFNTLIISTENGRLWKLTGIDSTDFQWDPFYSGSSAVGTETLGSIGDDVVYMRNGGVIESLRSTETFGDVKTDDLSRFIRKTVEDLTDCQTVYDQVRQKVYFFAGANKVLVLFKEMIETGLSPWSVYTTDHASSFSTNAAIYMRDPGGTDYNVYWGDDSGQIFKMEGVGAGDNGDTNIPVTRKSRFIEGLEGFDPRFQTLRGRVYYRRVADVDLVIDVEWGDDYAINQCTIPLEGPPVGDSANYYNAAAYYGGTFYYNTGFFYADRVSTKGFSPVGRGVGFYLQTTVTGNQNFDIIKLEL